MTETLAFNLEDPALRWLDDPRDRAIVGMTPVLPVPQYSSLPELLCGQYRFLLAANGLFVEARSRVLYLRAQVATTPRTPFGELTGDLRLAGGAIPKEIACAAIEHACTVAPSEWAGLILLDPDTGGYRLHEPLPENSSTGHIRYLADQVDHDLIAVDLHSHGHGAAYFSATDDADDRNGLYIACVLGNCTSPEYVSVATRICCHGIFINVPWTPWG